MTDSRTARIGVLLVDDQELIRYGLRLVLEAEPDIAVVGESDNGDGAVQAVGRLSPDVVLMDVRMPGTSGIEATRRIAQQHPSARVLVLTTYDRDEFAFGALQAGAAGFLLKNTPPADLVAAVRTVHRGDAVVSPRITGKLIEVATPHLPGAARTPVAARLDGFTDRERDVFALIGQGLSNTEIGARLHLSESTVKAHVGRVLAKLEVQTRVQAVIRAYELGVARVAGS